MLIRRFKVNSKFYITVPGFANCPLFAHPVISRAVFTGRGAPSTLQYKVVITTNVEHGTCGMSADCDSEFRVTAITQGHACAHR
jgi:hypothetical protein